ncbi:amidohydrolase family protein [Actinomycetes bacterium KLBMP 9759]
MTAISSAAPAPRRPHVVDIHAHAVPHDLLAALAEHGRGRRGSSLPELDQHDRLRFGERLTSPVPVALTDVGARLAAMDRCGVDVQVVSPWIELSPDELGRGARGDFLRLLNDGMADLAMGHPDRLRAFVLLDRGDPAAAAAELARTADRTGVVGAELPAGGSDLPLHDRAWDPLWAAASASGSLLLLHPWRARSAAALRGLRLADLVDGPAQTTAVVTAMVLAGVLDRFPELRMCVVHGGGTLPYLSGRIDALAPLVPGRPGGGQAPSAALRRLYYDSLTHSPESLAQLVAFAGGDRVLLGSDHPFPTGDAAAVRAVETAPSLTSSDRAAVLGGNACRLIGCCSS